MYITKSRSREEENIEKGVREGCNLCLITTVFILYIENGLKKLREKDIGGIKINEMLVQVLHFTDDVAVIASEEELDNMLTKMIDSC